MLVGKTDPPVLQTRGCGSGSTAGSGAGGWQGSDASVTTGLPELGTRVVGGQTELGERPGEQLAPALSSCTAGLQGRRR